MTEPNPKQAFAARLRELCDEKDMPARGRQTRLAELFKVTQGATRKWLTGEGMPELEMAIRIAEHFDVNVTWLLQGVGLKRGETVPTRALVVDEILSRGTAAERKELTDFLLFKTERSSMPLSQEELARYNAALQTYSKDGDRRRH